MSSEFGLRERKKRKTREALSSAALRLARQHGPENVRVSDIADAAGVSPRTYNNYFSSREQAIVAAVVNDRAERIANTVLEAGTDATLSEAVGAAIVEEFTDPGDEARDELLMITSSPTLCRAYVDFTAEIEDPLANALVERSGTKDELASKVLASSVSAAIQVALREWLQLTPSTPSSSLVVPSGTLPDLLRSALAPLTVALNNLSSQPGQADPAGSPPL